MKEFNNKDRADVIAPFMSAFAEEMFRNPEDEDLDTISSDFMADFCHWCNQHGLDVHSIVERGLNHYTEELFEEKLS